MFHFQALFLTLELLHLLAEYGHTPADVRLVAAQTVGDLALALLTEDNRNDAGGIGIRPGLREQKVVDGGSAIGRFHIGMVVRYQVAHGNGVAAS